MKLKPMKNLRLAVSAALLAALQATVLFAVMASQIGERALRGGRGFASYQRNL